MHSRIRSFVAVFAAVLLLLVVSLSAAHAVTDPLEAEKATVAQWFKDISDPALIDDAASLVSDEFVVHYPSGDVGWEQVKEGAQAFLSAMPDTTYTPLIMVAQGNLVGVRYEFSGTFTNPLTNWDGSVLQPTGKTVDLFSNAIVSFNDQGKIAGYQEVFDNMVFMAQLGAFPAPEGAISSPAAVDPAAWAIRETTPEFTKALIDSVSAANLAAYGKGDVDALDAAYAPDYVSYPTMSELSANKAQILALRTAIPDASVTYDVAIAEGNWIVYHWMVSGTFTHEFNYAGMTVTPTNKPVSYDGIVFAYANQDGLLAADWSEIDNLAVATQLGMLPAQ